MSDTASSPKSLRLSGGDVIPGKLDLERVPEHVAIIMDGNGRWAQERNMPRLWGHSQGYKALHQIVHDAPDLGVKYLTLYAFSSENWRRPKLEIDGLMRLIEAAVRNELNELHANNVRIRFTGRIHELPASLQREMRRDEEITAGNTRLTLNLCVNYGGRMELVDAARSLVAQAQRGEIGPEDVTPERFAQGLYTSDMPDPDLLIRTAGEMRISNYLLWQIAYSEIYVTQTLWPDFRTKHLIDALIDYQSRVRKFGGVVNA
ncbi:MAG: isoprenyl transferase [Armatimonadota bacterium]